MSFEQLVKKFPVINQTLAKIFGARLALLVALGDGVRRAVILDYMGMIDRDIFSPVFEVGHRIPSRAHNVVDEGIGTVYRGRRIVDEIALDCLPPVDKTLVIFPRQRFPSGVHARPTHPPHATRLRIHERRACIPARIVNGALSCAAGGTGPNR